MTTWICHFSDGVLIYLLILEIRPESDGIHPWLTLLLASCLMSLLLSHNTFHWVAFILYEVRCLTEITYFLYLFLHVKSCNAVTSSWRLSPRHMVSLRLRRQKLDNGIVFPLCNQYFLVLFEEIFCCLLFC